MSPKYDYFRNKKLKKLMQQLGRICIATWGIAQLHKLTEVHILAPRMWQHAC